MTKDEKFDQKFLRNFGRKSTFFGSIENFPTSFKVNFFNYFQSISKIFSIFLDLFQLKKLKQSRKSEKKII